MPFVQSGYAPIVLCCFATSALFVLMYTGYMTGRTIKQNFHRPMFIRFGDSKKFVHFGLVSMSPDYVLMSGKQLGKTDASLSKAQYYVDKNDHSKHQKVPGSLHFSAPAAPPPPPSGPPPKCLSPQL